MSQALIQDLLSLPLEERAKVHAQSPQISQMVDSFLSSDPDYNALGENERIALRTNLGFPSSPARPPQVVAYDPVGAKRKHDELLEGVNQPNAVRGLSFEIGKALDYYRELLGEGLDRKQMMLETPLGNVEVGSESIPGKIFRGNLSAVPGLSTVVPPAESGKEPDFFSIENAAKTATEMMLTAPFFAGEQTVLATQGFYQLFLKNPAWARAVANATAQALPLAAYQTLSKKINESIKNGEVSINGIATEYGKDVVTNIALLLGLHGVWSVGKAGVKYAGRKLGWKPNARVVDQVAQDIGEIERTPVGAPTLATEPLPSPEIINPVPQPRLTRIEPDKPPLIPAERNPMLETDPAIGRPGDFTQPAAIVPLKPGEVNLTEQSPTSLLLDEAQRAITTPVAPTQELLGEAGAAVGPRIPGFLQSAEDKLRQRLPKASAIIDDVMGSHKVDIAPDGTVSATVSEKAVDSLFVSSQMSMPGDLVYVNGKIVRVLEKNDKGIRAQSLDSNARYFVPHEKVSGKVDTPFTPGEVVFKENGEQVTIAKVLPNGKVQVIDEKGGRYAIAPEKLQTEAKKLELAENIERAQDGIAGPAPRGTSIFDLLSNEEGALMPRRTKRAPGTITITTVTEPDGKEFGSMRHFWSPVYTLLGMNDPKYTLMAQMLMESKAREQVVESNGGKMIRALREMIGEEKGAQGPFKYFKGGDDETSKRMTRALLGVSFPGERLSMAEDAAVTAFRSFGQKTIIPLLNERRAAIGLPPLPTDYNYLLHLFPEMLLTSGHNGNGIAKTFAPMIKITGVDNIVDMPFGNGSRIEINANFWDLADRLVKFAAHESAWRDSINYIVGIARADAKATNKKYLGWLARHLEGKQVDASIGDVVSWTQKVDNWMVRNGWSKEAATSIITPSGQRATIEVPIFSLADDKLSPVVLSARSWNYMAMIGFNARTMMLNLTQPVTNGMAQIPGSPVAAAFDMLTGYAKGIGTLLSKNAQQNYHELGILQTVEDLFAPAAMTKTTGTASLNTQYAASWLWNNLSSMAFMGMRAAEIINRVSVYEARKNATLRIAKGKGIDSAVLSDPEFMHSVENLAKYTTNISNFLYGKGFKSPMQAGEINIGNNRFNFGPLGELIYMFNTFATHHWGNMVMLAKQSDRFGAHQNAAIRMAMMDNGSKDFAEYVARMEPQNRNAFLKAWVYQSGLSMFLASALGLTSIGSQISPLGLISINPLTPIIKNLASMTKDLTSLDVVGVGKTASSTFTPGINAAQRIERMGGTWRTLLRNPRESLLATRSDVTGTQSPYSNKTINLILGEPGGSRAAK